MGGASGLQPDLVGRPLNWTYTPAGAEAQFHIRSIRWTRVRRFHHQLGDSEVQYLDLPVGGEGRYWPA